MASCLQGSEVANLLLGAFAFTSLAVHVCVVHFAVQPFERDFYCTDQSLQYTTEYKVDSDSVPMHTAAIVGGGVILLTVSVVEAVRCCMRLTNRPTIGQSDRQYAECLCCCCSFNSINSGWALCLITVARALLLAAVGTLVTEIFTATVKKTLGRHRPYFLSVCSLNTNGTERCKRGELLSVSMCSQQQDPVVLKYLHEAMQSFPSGHSSHSMYMTVFASLYLQSRFTFAKGHAVKWLLQCLIIAWGLYVCASRVSDYKHHWSDVLGGGCIGAVVGCIVCLYLRPSYLINCCRATADASSESADSENVNDGRV